jgi:predicted NBD/HSP70 family sugar kinase
MAARRDKRSTLQLSERTVLAAFADSAGYTRAELIERTGLSRAVVTAAVRTLGLQGRLVTVDAPAATGTRGRPSTRFRRSDLLSPVLLIELAQSTTTTLSVLDDGGATRRSVPGVPWSSGWDKWAPAIRDAAAELTNGGPDPRCAVIVAPFPVQEGAGQPAAYPLPSSPRKHPLQLPPSPPWLQTDPRPGVATLLGCPTIMINDANAAALGEAEFGAGRGYRALVYLSLRYGIGAGHVLDGALFAGPNGFAGELAHAQVTESGDFCLCGGRGCLATEIRSPDLLENLADVFDAPASFEQVTADLIRGEPMVARFFRDLGALIGRPLSSVVTVLDPDCVLVDARIDAAAAPLIAGLTAELGQRCPAALVSRLSVMPGALPDATARGALAAANAAQRIVAG